MYAKVDSELSDSFLKCEKWMKLGRHKWKERKVGWGHLTEENPAGGEIDDEEKWPRKQGLFQVGHCSSMHLCEFKVVIMKAGELVWDWTLQPCPFLNAFNGPGR